MTAAEKNDRPLLRGMLIGVIVVASILFFAPDKGTGGVAKASTLPVAASREYTITMYSGGKEIRSWRSEKGTRITPGGAFMFTDADSGEYVELTGDVVVEVDNRRGGQK